ncbi:MAG: Molybdopterin-guanine dinucleotide biosynthesis protein MobA [Myxococcaceae bacterium]|nr:Molybdopterin-guanine dinucleotide biosynthesis protein MobA [Myxococcaceae bacterium]
MLCGIFVGGKATRMQGQAKGLLASPQSGEPLVVRLARLARELGLIPVLVGEAASYRGALPELRVIADKPAGIGPIGGLAGLLHAGQPSFVLALSCDLPIISRQLLERLVNASTRAQVVAPRSSNGQWEPLAARYDAEALCGPVDRLISSGTRSFQRLFTDLRVEELKLSPAERAELIDWDTPEDVLALR